MHLASSRHFFSIPPPPPVSIPFVIFFIIFSQMGLISKNVCLVHKYGFLPLSPPSHHQVDSKAPTNWTRISRYLHSKYHSTVHLVIVRLSEPKANIASSLTLPIPHMENRNGHAGHSQQHRQHELRSMHSHALGTSSRTNSDEPLPTSRRRPRPEDEPDET